MFADVAKMLVVVNEFETYKFPSPVYETLLVAPATPEDIKYTKSPGFPAGPGPVDPCGPVAPSGPVDPCGPVAPSGPVDPCGPVAPSGPVDPVGPVAPSDPMYPGAPVAPVGPVAPTKLIKFDKVPPSP